MKSLLQTTLTLIGWVGLYLTACTPEPRVPAYCADEKLLAAALVRCVDKSDTREESRACRRDVHRSCGIAETVTKGAVH